MRHHRKLTDEERREIIEARAQGAPAAALARYFDVSPRTIYNTLSRAKASGTPRPARTKTVSMRFSDRDMTRFMAALAERGITDRPAALRCLIVSADKILMAPDPAAVATLHGWSAEIQRRGAAINQIARKLNEAKLHGRPLPYTAEDAAVIRELEVFLATFTADFQALWEAKRAAMSQEVDKALAGLEAKKLGVQ